MRSVVWASFVLLVAFASGCGAPARPDESRTPAVRGTAEPPAAPTPSPATDEVRRVEIDGLPASEPFVSLPVEGHLDAVVAVPVGAPAPRPVLVATRGAGGSPEEHCEHWQRLLGGRAFILCPRGVALKTTVPLGEGQYFYDGHPRLVREVRLALVALSLRFGGLVDTQGAVYAGYSQGATMGALALPLMPGLFSRALLIEGGDAEWDRRAARIFKAEGGQRVLFACGRSRCAENARRSAGYLEKESVETRVLHAEGAGHTYGGPVEELVRGSFEWLVEGDSRWSPPP